MILLSGLQKEDLDAGTLEKLSRHNVNIDDMNNEERRQECLLDSYSLKGNDTKNNAAEVQVQTTKAYTVTSERAENYVSVEKLPTTRARTENNIVDKTILYNYPNINKNKSILDQHKHVTPKLSPIVIAPPIKVLNNNKIINSLANAQKDDENKGLQIEFQNQPDVETIMNFWSKLTQHAKTVVTSLPALPTMPTISEEKNITTTVRILSPQQENANAKNMAFISKLLTDFLETQTRPTTQKTTTEGNTNYLPIEYTEKENQYGINEELFKLLPTKTNEPKNEKNEAIKRIKVTQDDVYANKDILTPMSEESNSMLFKFSKPQNIQDMAYNLILNEPKIKVLNPAKAANSGPIKFWEQFKPKHKPQKVLNLGKDPSQNFAPYNNQFIAALTENDSVKQLNTFRGNKFLNRTVNKSENFDSSSNRVKIRPGHIKRTKIDKTFKGENVRFKTLLPSIKNAKQNDRTTNNLSKFSYEELNKSEQNDNDFTITLEDARQDRLPETNYDQYNDEPKTVRTMKPRLLELSNGNENEDMPPEIKESERIEEDAVLEIKSIPERYKFEQHKERRMPENELIPTQNFGSKVLEPEAIPANILQEIAEKVKQIVLKDIGKEATTVRLTPPEPTETREYSTSTMSTTLAPTTVTSTTVAPTTTTTTAPTTVTPSTTTAIITISDTQSTLQKEITEANQVINRLMEIFKELKSLKPVELFAHQMPLNTTVIVPTTVQATTRLPDIQQTYQQDAFNPYIMKGPAIKTVDVNPYLKGIMPVQRQAAYNSKFPVIQINDNRPSAITIQTNDDEIAPLAIQISQPQKVINQHIVVTTKRSVDKIKEELVRESKKRIDDSILLPIEDSNHREKHKIQSDYSKKVRFGESQKRQDFHDQYSYKSRFIKDREKSWHSREYNEKFHHFDNHAMGSRFRQESIHYPGGISNLENLDRQKGLSNSESLSYNGGINRPSFTHHNEKPRIKQSGTFSQSDYDHEPRYESKKFHEKLERIENRPRHSWKEVKTMPTDTSYDEVSARQQEPMVKVKQRTRFDDSHFTNFLKSQQKVTDMLEKILANNMKNSSPNSVEVP
uniref:Uncharacterized protein n=1 Tax=Heliothis virescens TaxID=7102 RepID=A0A2A4JNL9_HELVI